MNQITIVSPGQIVPLQFGGGGGGGGGGAGGLESAAWMKVVAEDFGTGYLKNQKMDTDDDDDDESDGCSLELDAEFDSSSSSCSDSFIDENDTPNRPKCVRLMAETEVIVIPKPRLPQNDDQLDDRETSTSNVNDLLSKEDHVYCPSGPLRIQPTYPDVSRYLDIVSGEESTVSLFPNPPLGFVYVHPSTLLEIPGYKQCNDIIDTSFADQERLLPPMVVTMHKVDRSYSPEYETKRNQNDGCDVVVATIQASNDMHSGHVSMHPLLRYQLGAQALGDWVSIQVWSETHVANSISTVRDGKATMLEVVNVSSSILQQINTGLSETSVMNEKEIPSCEYCRRDKSQSTSSFIDDTIRADPVFGSGSFISAEFLQQRGIDLSDRHCHSMVAVKLHDTNHMRQDTTRLVPIITIKDLNEALGSEMAEICKEEQFRFLQAHNFQVTIPEDLTVGFSSAMQSAKQSARQILSLNHVKLAKPMYCESESIKKHAIMITGEEGSGKTHLSTITAAGLSLADLCSSIYLDCKKLQASSSNIQYILEKLHKCFQEALQKQPSILVLDDLDALIPNVESSGADGDGSIQHHRLNPALVVQVKIIVDHLLLQSQQCLRSTSGNIWNLPSGVVLICTCNDKDSLSSRYQSSGVFHSLVEVPSLDSSQRAQLVHNKVFGNKLMMFDKIPHAIVRLGKDTDGFRPRDMNNVATRIVHLDCLRKFNSRGDDLLEEPRKSTLNTLEEDIASIIDDYEPISRQLVDIEHNACTMEWSEIGGLRNAKQSLYDIIIHPMKFKAVYDNAPISLPTGVLLYGPPGNGKSFIVPLLAKKSRLNLITCRGPELLDRYIGASEAKVRQLFARAAAAAPAMIFFDEFDSLAPQRGSDHTGVTDRVVNQLLTLLDGAERSKNASHIFVVAATSRPDKIDKALLRPGRLEKHVYVGFAESLQEWNSLFSSLLKTRNIDDQVSDLMQRDGDLFDMFCKDFGYAREFSAADMNAVLDTAHLICVHEILDNSKGEPLGAAVMGKHHILEAFRRTRPSMLPKDRHALKNIYSSFGSNQLHKDSSQAKPHGQKTSLR